MRTHKHITSVTADSDFAYVQFDCGQVTVKRDGNRIILIPGPSCELASRGNLSIVEGEQNYTKAPTAKLGLARSLWQVAPKGLCPVDNPELENPTETRRVDL